MFETLLPGLLFIETGWLCAGSTWLVYYYKNCSAVSEAKDVTLGKPKLIY